MDVLDSDSIEIPSIKRENDIPVSDMSSGNELSQEGQYASVANYNVNLQTFPESSKHTIKEENDIHVGDVKSSKDFFIEGQNSSEVNYNVDLQTLPESSLNDEELKRLRTKMVEDENRAFILARELMYKNLHSDEGKDISKNEDDSQLYETLSTTQYDKMYAGTNEFVNGEENIMDEPLIYHVMRGTPKPFCCTSCDYRSVRKDKIKRHLLIHTDRRYEKAVTYVEKVIISHENEIQQYEHEAEALSTSQALSTSLFEKMFADAKKVQDAEAKKAEESLMYHFLPGTPKPFCCTLCDYRSQRKDKMKRHFTIHSDTKPLACPLCDYRCARNDKLKKHMQIHGFSDYQKRGQKRKMTDENDDNVENSVPSISDYHNNTTPEVITGFTPSTDMDSHDVDSTGTLTTNSTMDASFNKNSEVLEAHRTLVPYIPSFLGKPKTPIKKWQYACHICDRKYKLEDSLVRHMEIHTGPNDSGIIQSVSISSELSNNMHTEQNNELYKLPSHSMFSQGIKSEAECKSSVNNTDASNNGDLGDSTTFHDSSIDIKQESNKELENERDMSVKEESLDDTTPSDDEMYPHIAEPEVIMEEGNESDDEYFSHMIEPMVVVEEYKDSSVEVNLNFDQEAYEHFNSELYRNNIGMINKTMEQSAMFSGTNKNPVRKWVNVCPICDRKYKLRESLIGHMDIHKNDENYLKYMESFNLAAVSESDISNFYQAAVSEKNISKADLSIIEVEKEHVPKLKVYICNYCDYKCACKSKFVIHERTHTKEKPFACTVCDFKCSRKDKLKSHMLRHTNEKPFACSECEYRCKRSEALKQHMITHVGEDQKKSMSVESLLSEERYNNSEHETSPGAANIHNTTISPSKLNNVYSSYFEEKTIPGKKWSFACPVCERKFKFRESLVRHMEVHNGSNLDGTNINEKSNDSKSFKCPVCDYIFSQRSALDLHMMIHTGEKPYACGICQYSCNQKGNLKRHVLQHHGRNLETEYNALIDIDYEAEPNEENISKTDIIQPSTYEEKENKEKLMNNDLENDFVQKDNFIQIEEEQNELQAVSNEENISQTDTVKPNTCVEKEEKEIILKNCINNDSSLTDNLTELEEENFKSQTGINLGELTVIENMKSIPKNIDNFMMEKSIE